MTINDKIKQVLTIKNLSPSHLADDIGVQRSSISHILSGRNRPSLDIIQRIVRRFPEFTYDWFLEEDLQITTNRSLGPETTTSTEALAAPGQTSPATIMTSSQTNSSTGQTVGSEQPALSESLTVEAGKAIDRILLFYTDGTFREYTPASR